MNRKTLRKAVAQDCSITQKEAGIVVDSVLDNVMKGATEDGKVTLVGFGTLFIAQAKARKARNPRTGEPIDVPAKRVVKFRPSAKFKEAALEGNLASEVAEQEDSDD